MSCLSRARPARRALEPLPDLFSILLARIIHEYRLEAFETEPAGASRK